MEWLWAAVGAWFGWNVLAPVICILLVAVAVILSSIPTAIKQSRCEHPRYFETGSCDAVCKDCGRNLGFIGSWREKMRKQEQIR